MGSKNQTMIEHRKRGSAPNDHDDSPNPLAPSVTTYTIFPPHLASKLWTAGKPIIVFISENGICAGPPVPGTVTLQIQIAIAQRFRRGKETGSGKQRHLIAQILQFPG